jgi:hypothetical protein
MRPPTVAPHEFAPVFNWTPPRNRNVSLISFIAGSAVLHALCFYVFQIIYPPTVALLPPPARVNIITPATEKADCCSDGSKPKIPPSPRQRSGHPTRPPSISRNRCTSRHT